MLLEQRMQKYNGAYPTSPDIIVVKNIVSMKNIVSYRDWCHLIIHRHCQPFCLIWMTKQSNQPINFLQFVQTGKISGLRQKWRLTILKLLPFCSHHPKFLRRATPVASHLWRRSALHPPRGEQQCCFCKIRPGGEAHPHHELVDHLLAPLLPRQLLLHLLTALHQQSHLMDAPWGEKPKVDIATGMLRYIWPETLTIISRKFQEFLGWLGQSICILYLDLPEKGSFLEILSELEQATSLKTWMKKHYSKDFNAVSSESGYWKFKKWKWKMCTTCLHQILVSFRSVQLVPFLLSDLIKKCSFCLLQI